jgi:hypothetical protein
LQPRHRAEIGYARARIAIDVYPRAGTAIGGDQSSGPLLAPKLAAGMQENA